MGATVAEFERIECISIDVGLLRTGVDWSRIGNALMTSGIWGEGATAGATDIGTNVVYFLPVVMV